MNEFMLALKNIRRSRLGILSSLAFCHLPAVESGNSLGLMTEALRRSRWVGARQSEEARTASCKMPREERSHRGQSSIACTQAVSVQVSVVKREVESEAFNMVKRR